MPQAAQVLTVSFHAPPTGIFHDLCGDPRAMADTVQQRLSQISALLFLTKNSGELHPTLYSALAGIESLVDDTVALLDIVQVQECLA